MPSKYVAVKDGQGFAAGDDVTVAQVGENAEQLIADGVIAERADSEAQEAKAAAQSAGPMAAADRPKVSGSGSGTFVTLGNSGDDGIPQVVAVRVNEQVQG